MIDLGKSSTKYLLEVKKCTFFNALNDGIDQTFGTFIFTSALSIELCQGNEQVL